MIDWKHEWKRLLGIAAVFLVFFWLPVDQARFAGGVMESLHLAKWYARKHVLLCLVPAFFIAGAIGVFIRQASVMKYLGARANQVLAYGVASVSGGILAVCSCTVLPLFAGIYKMGAGLGPATAFLYSGPAINVLAIILTARILGLELGIARAVGAIVFSIVIGLIMHVLYRKEESEAAAVPPAAPEPEEARSLAQNALFFFVLIGVLVFANWGAPNDWRFTLADGRTFRAAITRAPEAPASAGAVYRVKMLAGPEKGREVEVAAAAVVEKTARPGLWTTLWKAKWLFTAGFAAALGGMLVWWFSIRWWKVLAAGAAVFVTASALPMQGLMVMVPFAVGVVGLSVMTATTGGEAGEWLAASWGFAKQILPLLFFGVLVAGFLLGRPGQEGVVPARYVQMLVGDSPDRMLAMTGEGGGAFESFARAVWPVWTNFFASIFGAFMYFATLTEVPILQGLIGAGMGKGPALALLLAGPALSLPNMLVIRSIMGTRKTIVYCSLVVVMATISGVIFGAVWG